MSRLVVKLGGAVATELAPTIRALAEEGHELCVVHGAGPQITQQMERLGLPVEFVGGRRRTSRAALDVVRSSFAQVNEELCAAIGAGAVGLFGDEVGLLAVRLPMLGWVGNPVPSRPCAIVAALEAGLIPVVAPLAVGPLNVNADDAAAALALGLGAEQLLFLSDVGGLIVDGILVEQIEAGAAHELLAAGTLAGGIVPKLQAAVAAAREGVPVVIGRTAVTA